MNFVQTLRKRSELQPGVPALVDRCISGDRVLTYSGLNRLVDYLSFELREKKLATGDRILIGIGPSQEMYVYLLAALQIGAVPILCDHAAPQDEFISWINALEPKACIIPTRGWVGSHFDGVLRKIPSKIFVGHVRSQSRWLRPHHSRTSEIFMGFRAEPCSHCLRLKERSSGIFEPMAHVIDFVFLQRSKAALFLSLFTCSSAPSPF